MLVGGFNPTERYYIVNQPTTFLRTVPPDSESTAPAEASDALVLDLPKHSYMYTLRKSRAPLMCVPTVERNGSTA